jgi:D-beta-D-heptose 7-phosphate kinase/D-beta-D-heptose 1-phosphate adenosyltransferase
MIDRDRLRSLLDAAASRRIAIVGDAMLDVYLHGDADRISPEAPVPVVRVREERAALGGAANVANNVLALRARCELVATVGRDEAGRRVRTMLTAASGDTRGLMESTRRTTTKTRLIAHGQQVVRFDDEDDSECGDAEVKRLLALVDAAVADADAVVLEDYNKGVLIERVIRHAIDAATARRIPVVVDPKYKNFFAFRGATVFKPNRRELEAALGAAVDLDQPAALPEAMSRLGVANLLLTLGERGMALLSEQGDVYRIPTRARAVFDVVGAGDTVTAYLALVLAAGGTVREAAEVANFAAGVEVGKLGAATVSADEMMNAYDRFSEEGVVARADGAG